jgi:hypothetical protein
MAALLGGIPLMLGTGTGAEIRQPPVMLWSADSWLAKRSLCSRPRSFIFTLAGSRNFWFSKIGAHGIGAAPQTSPRA